MEESKIIVNKTKKQISFFLISYLIISVFSLYFKVINERLNLWSFISIGIGVFIILSLYAAKKWAKNYITISCVLLLVMTIPSTIGLIITSHWLFLIIQLFFISWLVYVVRFLNVGETYQKYSELIGKGFDYTSSTTKTLSQLLENRNSIKINLTEFKSPIDYYNLLNDIIKIFSLDKNIENLSINENIIEVEAKETIFEIQLDDDKIFFDKSFISKVNQVLSSTSESQEYLKLIFPDSVINKKEVEIVFINDQTHKALIENGYSE